MKRWFNIMSRGAVLAALIVGGFCVASGDAVEPASCTFSNVRGESVGYVSTETYYDDATLRLTNCIAYSGTTTNSAVQGLSNVTVTVSCGTATTNVDYNATVMVASNGTWSCDIVVPSFTETPYVQVKLTDANTNSYIYPWKQIRTKSGM